MARSREDLREILASLLKALSPHEARVRLILDTTSESGSLYILLQTLAALQPMLYERGVHVETSRSSREKPSLKQTAFIAQSSSDRKRVGGEIYEILLTHKGRVLEGMTSNFFYVREGALYTAGRGVLIGVTRQTLIALAKWEGIEIHYKALRLKELSSVDEAFITSSSRGVVPVVQIDAQQIRNGEVGDLTKKLMRLYDEEVLSIGEEIV